MIDTGEEGVDVGRSSVCGVGVCEDSVDIAVIEFAIGVNDAFGEGCMVGGGKETHESELDERESEKSEDDGWEYVEGTAEPEEEGKALLEGSGPKDVG